MNTHTLNIKCQTQAKRYANVIFDLAAQEYDTDKFFSELTLLNEAVKKVPSITRAFDDKMIPVDKRLEAVRQVSACLSLSKLATNTALYLAGKDRFFLFPNIVKEFRTILETLENLSRADVTVASEDLKKDAKEKIERILSQILKKKSVCTVTIDPEIIGGMTLKVGDVTIDDSVRGKLYKMRQSML